VLDILTQPARACFCEQPVNGFLRHPADTWTNLGPIVAGILVMCRAQAGMLMLLGASAVWMGAASAVFHATGTLGGEALDIHGMYCFLIVLRLLQVEEGIQDTFWTTWDDALGVFGFATLLAVGFLFYPWLGTPTFAVLLGLLVISQWKRGFNSQWYWMMGTFAVAYAFWLLDYHRILCCPTCHVLTGHGVWHLLNGVIVWQAFKIFEAASDERRGYVLR
jgi:hypothetical protein